MNGIKYIFQKEMARIFRDKKMVFSLFILPVVLIIGMYSLMGSLAVKADKDVEQHQSIVYVQNAPDNFAQVLSADKEIRINYISQTEDVKKIKDNILNGKADLLLVFDEMFEEKISAFKVGDEIPQVKTYYNPSEDYSDSARSKFIETFLPAYKEILSEKRFGNLESLKIFDVDRENQDSVIQDEGKASGKMLGMILPYFITLMLFAGAMGLGVDMITGEKERGTMASMLITPVKRIHIVIGKLLSLMALSILSALIYLVSMIVSMPVMMKTMGGGNMEGMTVSFSVSQIIGLVAIVFSLVFLYVSMVALVAVYAKTAKEANTYVTPCYIIVIAVGMVTMFSSGEPSLISYCIPIYGNAIALKDIFTQDISAVELLVSTISTIVSGGILTALIVKAFNSEKIMFNA